MGCWRNPDNNWAGLKKENQFKYKWRINIGSSLVWTIGLQRWLDQWLKRMTSWFLKSLLGGLRRERNYRTQKRYLKKHILDKHRWGQSCKLQRKWKKNWKSITKAQRRAEKSKDLHTSSDKSSLEWHRVLGKMMWSRKH